MSIEPGVCPKHHAQFYGDGCPLCLDTQKPETAKEEDLKAFMEPEKPAEREICFLCHKEAKVDSSHQAYALLTKFLGKTYKRDFCSVECLQEHVEGLV